ncbi:hypothetical protein CUMW_264570 [Citrus unshiu]|uniref:Uncharacterized protein n=2 Tax=Citrus TaxID=2706 RepID=A0A2H5QW20_CITUN|nr:hypothetical protein CUMW_264570 [Citrus unshiu]
MLADPAFLYKLLVEQAPIIGCTVWWELENRKDRRLINVCSLSFPNNILERSCPFREFDLQKRIHSLFYKAAELCMVGLTAGAVQGSLSNYLAGKKDRLSVTIPSVSTNALGYGAFLGLCANMRYQLLCGFDRAVINHFDVIGVALFLSTALRSLPLSLLRICLLIYISIYIDRLFWSNQITIVLMFCLLNF